MNENYNYLEHTNPDLSKMQLRYPKGIAKQTIVIHPTAYLAEDVKLDGPVEIEANVSIGSGTTLNKTVVKKNTIIGADCHVWGNNWVTIGEDVTIGNGSYIYGNVGGGSKIGHRSTVRRTVPFNTIIGSRCAVNLPLRASELLLLKGKVHIADACVLEVNREAPEAAPLASLALEECVNVYLDYVSGKVNIGKGTRIGTFYAHDHFENPSSLTDINIPAHAHIPEGYTLDADSLVMIDNDLTIVLDEAQETGVFTPHNGAETHGLDPKTLNLLTKLHRQHVENHAERVKTLEGRLRAANQRHGIYEEAAA